MNVIEGIQKVHRHCTIILYPILFDLISLAIGWSIVGFYRDSTISIRLILEMGFPSVSHLSNIPLFINNIDFLNTTADIPSYTWLLVIIILMIGAFLQGGYIKYLYAIVRDKDFGFTDFLKEGKRTWLQFILLEVIIFLAKLSITAVLALFFGIIGVFASLVFMTTLRIIFVYLEFTIAVDGLSINAAMKRSRKYFKKTLFNTLTLVFIMYTFTAGLSYLIHLYWLPATVVGLIFIYAYTMSIIQTLLMSTLNKAKIGHAFTPSTKK